MFRSAMIGCGRIASLLENDPLRYKPCTHAGGAAAAGISFTHACDNNPERLDRFRLQYAIPQENCHLNYTDLLTGPPFDLIVIATWTDSHCHIASLAAKNKARVIVLEKPICANLVQAQKLIQLCEKNGTALIINHERRYDPRYGAAKKIITSGVLGQLRSISGLVLTSGNFGLNETNQGGGPLLHDGTHMIDMIRFFAGEVTTVQGRFERYDRDSGFEQRSSAWLTTESGIDVFCQAGGKSRFFHFELDMIGTEGRLIMGNGINQLFTASPSVFYKGFRDLKEKKFPRYKNENCFTNLYREVKKILSGKQTTITSSGIDGYRALEVIHGIYYSHHKGKKIDLPLKPRTISLNDIFSIPQR